MHYLQVFDSREDSIQVLFVKGDNIKVTLSPPKYCDQYALEKMRQTTKS